MKTFERLLRTLIRLNFVQTLFGKDIEFSLRVFRFTVGGQSTTDQRQTIGCELYLESADDVSEEQAADCSCYTHDDCQDDVGSSSNTAFSLMQGYFRIKLDSRVNVNHVFKNVTFSIPISIHAKKAILIFI